MNEFKVDLLNCDIEPIHILGKIQSHGFLIAVNNETHQVSYVSENISVWVQNSVQHYINLPFEVLEKEIEFTVSSVGLTISQMITIGNGRYPEINNPLQIEIKQVPYYLIINVSGEDTILEFEPITPESQIDLQQTIGKSMSAILSAKSMDSMFQKTALEIKRIINFDRVMVYQFNEEGDGKIIAEAKTELLDPFLGLYYPASDIPKQARELYKVNLTRIIADVNSVDAALVGSPNDQALDLTNAGLRAVSPIHIQYLRNMGVESSFSISLISGNELWGLIVCHNYSPSFINYKAREAAKLLGEILSSALEYRQGEEDSELFLSLNVKVDNLIEHLEKEDDVLTVLNQHAASIKDITSACGVALVFDQNITTSGITPTNAQIKDIAVWLQSNMAATIYHTHRFPQIFSPALQYSQAASGILAYMLAREPGEFIIWFKQEQINQISWAGNPEKKPELNTDGLMQLSPRKSFDSWTDLVKNTSERWNRAEIAAVINLGEHTTYIIKRKVNEIKRLNELLKQSYDELNIFSYTITHDLRTPLSAIKSYAELLMINNTSLDIQAQKVLGRINACADRMALLITEILNYSMLGKADVKTDVIDVSSMILTIKAEVIAGLKADDLHFEIGECPPIQGDAVLVNQVFTNLINNAVKYSANSNPAKVSVSGMKKGKEIIYSITDNGIGIDNKYYHLVFELFKRMDNVKGFEGTGVGLAIVKRIMEKHHGKVWFESNLGLGTTFYLSFECLD